MSREEVITAILMNWSTSVEDMAVPAGRVYDRVIAPLLDQARREGAEQGWDEGWCAGVSRFTQMSLPATENPYRADAIARGEQL